MQYRKREKSGNKDLMDIREVYSKNIEMITDMIRRFDSGEGGRHIDSDGFSAYLSHSSIDQKMQGIRSMVEDMLENIQKFADISSLCEKSYLKWCETNRNEYNMRRGLVIQIDSFVDDFHSNLLSHECMPV